tara:strand:- start:518 stop:4714 length:4197 start_codon:yes stop_codon:yes gene_type:complete
MKNFYPLILIILLTFNFNLLAQVGPGGVGNSANIEAWMDVSKLTGLSDNDSVSSWTDFSGNENNADVVAGFSRPIFLVNQINGKPAINFAGAELLEFTSHIQDTEITLFSIHQKNIGAPNVAPFALENHGIFDNTNNSSITIYKNPLSTNIRINKVSGSYSVFSLTSEAGISGVNLLLTNGTASFSGNRNEGLGHATSSIGGRNLNGTGFSSGYNSLFQGSYAEFIVYNEKLNSAKRKIVSNYLAAKYNLTAEQNLYAFKTSYGSDVIGIGQESDGNHTQSRGQDGLEIFNPSTLNDGDYLLVGNDLGGYATSTSVSSDAVARWTQVWRADLTGTPGTVSLTFDLSPNNFATDPNNYVVYSDDDGNFSNGGTNIQESGRIYDGLNQTVTFTGISLSDGDFFTLAEKSTLPPSAVTIYGPGGVGNSSNIEAWMDASRLTGFSNNDSVNIWTDFSGNGNDANVVAGFSRPIFLVNQINGKPAINFTGAELLEFTSHIRNTEITLFSIHKKNIGAPNVAPFALENHGIFDNTNNSNIAIYKNPLQTNLRITKPSNSYSVFSLSSDAGVSGANVLLTNGNGSSSGIRREGLGHTTSNIGGRNLNGTGFGSGYNNLFQGSYTEFIVYNEKLNSAKRRIVSNYLAAKYNLVAERALYAFKTAYGNDVIGIGQEVDGNHILARGQDSLQIFNASALNIGDYLLVGHDGGALTTTAAVGGAFAANRLNRIWRADVTNTPGTVDLKFFLSGNNFAVDPNTDYRLLIDNVNGTFDNAGISQSLTGSYNAIDESITFTGVALNDGDFFTLGDRPGVITAIASTAWNLPTTWDCSCIPTTVDNVVIPSPFNVSIIGTDANAGSLTIETGGTLTFSTDNNLNLDSDFLVNGSISMNTGKVTFNGSSEQEFWNTSASPITLWDLEVDNSNGVSLKNGAFELTNFVTVSAGQLINDGAQFTFISDASNHSQIEPSVTNGFSGNFIMNRFFTSRNAGYADLTTPVITTTVGDWDQELFMSGVSGDDGNATDGAGGPIQYTVWKYDNSAMSWVAVTDTNTTISAGEPIELFLGDNLTTFSAQTMDNRGTPFTGPRTFNLTNGFNFIGNPYRSFINYTTVTKPAGVNSQFYIFVQNSGAYQLFTGGFIASEQGFWINSTANTTITFQESNKFPLNSNQILRQKRDLRFELAVRNLENGFGNNVSLVATDNTADNAAYLPSPEKTAPAITIQADGQELIQQSLATTASKTTIALDFYASLDGSYSLSAKDVSEIAGVYNCIVLEDKLENKLVELQENSSYTFNALKGNYERFNLHLLKSSNDCDELLRKRNTTISSTEELQLTQRGNIIELTYQLEEGVQAQLDILSLNGQKAAPSINLSLDGQGTEILMNNENLKGIYLFVLRTNDKVITEKFRLN